MRKSFVLLLAVVVLAFSTMSALAQEDVLLFGGEEAEGLAVVTAFLDTYDPELLAEDVMLVDFVQEALGEEAMQYGAEAVLDFFDDMTIFPTTILVNGTENDSGLWVEAISIIGHAHFTSAAGDEATSAMSLYFIVAEGTIRQVLAFYDGITMLQQKGMLDVVCQE
ncbi:MAG: hypothetical protein M5R40_14885 [Anaerolineae bacterium]|nr:hypothetical protein [Anaerolineae bacterium]